MGFVVRTLLLLVGARRAWLEEPFCHRAHAGVAPAVIAQRSAVALARLVVALLQREELAAWHAEPRDQASAAILVILALRTLAAQPLLGDPRLRHHAAFESYGAAPGSKRGSSRLAAL